MGGLDGKRILLVHPLGYRAEAAGGDVSRIANLMPPLGLAGIAAYLERRGMRASIVDCFAEPRAEPAIRERLLAERPAWIGFSCTTSSFLDGVRLAQLAKAALPGITSVFGGAHVSALRERVLERFPDVDLVVAGEGEETLAELGAFDEDWERMDCMHFLFVPRGMERARLEALFTEFYKRHYTRPRVLWGYATMLWKSPDSWRRFAGNLGSFWRFARTDRRLGEHEARAPGLR